MQDSTPSQTCPWCKQEQIRGLHEAWGHEFMLDTCCEGMHQALAQDLAIGGKEAVTLLQSIGGNDFVTAGLRNIGVSGPAMELDYRLDIRSVRFGVCKSFVLQHHHHCRPPAGWRFGAGCFNGPTMVGVAMVGRPVARMLDASEIVEVNRLCINRDLSDEFRRNAASKLLGWSAREAKRRGFKRIITYTLESEGGDSLRAAGWQIDGRSAGGSWSRPSRERGDSGPTDPKVRWTRHLT